jgi:malonate transporter and related proteins
VPSVTTLALPFFGLILLGYVFGKLLRYPEEGLRWMNVFIVYVALPSLFFKLIAATPFEDLANWPFVTGTTLSTFIAFSLAFAIGLKATGGAIAPAAIQGVVGAYANVGYMGPGLTIAALGQASIVPTALIFVFDSVLLFTLVPLLMALAGAGARHWRDTLWTIVRRVATHPFNIASALAVLASWLRLELWAPLDTMLGFLKNAAAPCALFTMGVTVALRQVRKIPPELPALLAVKLVLHPLIVWLMLSWLGHFSREWTFTALLMASLPPALNVFVLANQYHVYVERASTAILIGTLVSVATVTTLLYLVTHDLIPVDLLH